MNLHPAAGHAPDAADLIDVPAVLRAYTEFMPTPTEPAQRVVFGTSGHRGSALRGSFNEAHVLAITQAVCEYRAREGIDGPLFLGRDTHALSAPAHVTVLEVLAANGVEVRHAGEEAYTPTPVISHAILRHNRGRARGYADGLLITPSHNPPEDGGLKYNPPHGGPADSDVTGFIEARANTLLGALGTVKRIPYSRALKAAGIRVHDFVSPYVGDLAAVIDFDVMRTAGLAIAVDPLGGAGVAFWPAIAEVGGLNLTVLNAKVDPAFPFLRRDWDGKLRMDPSSVHVMAGVAALRNHYDLVLACDADHDRHGIVTRATGLMLPNDYLAIAIDYLLDHRRAWPSTVAVGKTLVSSALIDRVAARHHRPLYEVPVGFKWFVPGLLEGRLGFAGEESAGATFLRTDGTPWTTDKDGILLCLLAAEMAARTGRDPGERYRDLVKQLGEFCYARLDAPATPEVKKRLAGLHARDIAMRELAGDPVLAIRTTAPGNAAPIGGIKIETAGGWVAARPSGTEDVYKIYAESFRDPAHLARLQEEAQAMISRVTAV